MCSLLVGLLSRFDVRGLQMYIALVGLDGDNDVYMIWSSSMLSLSIAYYDVIDSINLHVVVKWVLYVVHGTCSFICEVGVLGYSMFLWIPMSK